MSRSFAPIALFAYNRVDHLKRTVEALQKNDFASDSELYIFSDGARNELASKGVEEVRKFIHSVSGFKTVKIVEQKENRGLAQSIIEGVTKLTNEYGKVIVLEDDIVTSPRFLRYMNDALDFYENEPKVMHISGYNFPMTHHTFQETYFITPATCWGWATWKRSWRFFIRDTKLIIPQFTAEMIKDFNLGNANPYFDQLLKNDQGKMNTWAIFWHAALYLNHGLSLHPVKSFCKNIGHDGTGEHCSESTVFDVSLNTVAVTHFEKKIAESAYFRRKVAEFFMNAKPPILQRVRNRLKRMFRN